MANQPRQPWQGPPPSGQQIIIPSIVSGGGASSIVPIIQPGLPSAVAVVTPGVPLGCPPVRPTPTPPNGKPSNCVPSEIPWGSSINLRSVSSSVSPNVRTECGNNHRNRDPNKWLGLIRERCRSNTGGDARVVAALNDFPVPWTMRPLNGTPARSTIVSGNQVNIVRGTSQFLRATSMPASCGGGNTALLSVEGSIATTADTWNIVAMGKDVGDPLLFGDVVFISSPLSLESLDVCAVGDCSPIDLVISQLEPTPPLGLWRIESHN